MNNKAVFLDRDDTLIQDPGYISNPSQVKLAAGACQAIWQLKKMGFLIIVVTNQSGIARGLVTEDQLEEVHRRLTDLLASEGVYLDGLYFCPYHPEGTVVPYNRDSDLRKPKPGMLLLAAKEKEIDLTESWMIGDSYRDIAAGQAAGCHTILVDVPGKPRVKKVDEPEAERKAVNLREAVNIIRMHEFHQKVHKVKSNTYEAGEQGKPEPSVPTAAAAFKDRPSQNLMPPPKETAKTTAEVSAAAPAAAAPVPKEVEPFAQTKKETPNAPQRIAAEPAKAAGHSEPTGTKTPEKQPGETIVKARTFKKIAEPSETEAAAEDRDHTTLLQEILRQVKNRGRDDLYHEFSIFKLLAMMLQMLAVLCLIGSVIFWLSPKSGYEKVFVTLGFTIALQLMVIALMMYQDN